MDYWAAAISRWANASNLDPNLVAVVMQIESCGNPSARSSAGAMGLFQVMPFHFFVTDSMTRTQMPRVDWLISSALSMRPRMMFDWHWQVITAVSASLQALN
ncbi:MAG: transglycosylase SLT domain-containing protein [Chloroflexi bacterium]|nr:transglycosylase SLT domain-containing protein [Chloroflexota bacterium]